MQCLEAASLQGARGTQVAPRGIGRLSKPRSDRVRVGFVKAADRMHLNLKAKFALLTRVMVLAVGVILTPFLPRQQENTIRDELLNRAVALTEQLAYNCQ